MRTHDDKLEPKAIRRLELITGTGRRRAWSREEKARIGVIVGFSRNPTLP